MDNFMRPEGPLAYPAFAVVPLRFEQRQRISRHDPRRRRRYLAVLVEVLVHVYYPPIIRHNAVCESSNELVVIIIILPKRVTGKTCVAMPADMPGTAGLETSRLSTISVSFGLNLGQKPRSKNPA